MYIYIYIHIIYIYIYISCYGLSLGALKHQGAKLPPPLSRASDGAAGAASVPAARRTLDC